MVTNALFLLEVLQTAKKVDSIRENRNWNTFLVSYDFKSLVEKAM